MAQIRVKIAKFWMFQKQIHACSKLTNWIDFQLLKKFDLKISICTKRKSVYHWLSEGVREHLAFYRNFYRNVKKFFLKIG